ncbi:hypothetical protein AAG570_001162 [Ranatra chinensis]|uniref:NADH dehydrogenase [ubiquinone] 1 alpha subcomplex subunit 9, mitochondrial n=1 Tax=Ranatra chinensis TaxID=642074 RepID=A0ABD0YBB6_9HEMI
MSRPISCVTRRILDCLYVQKSSYQKSYHKIKFSGPHALERGTGGRSSFNGLVATVFGASGFLGRYVCNRLGKIGTQIVIPYRGNSEDVLCLKLTGDLGQVLFMPYHLKDNDSVRRAIEYSNIVVNLVGRDWETKNCNFSDINECWPQKLGLLCREHGGIEKLIHVSALNACENTKSFLLKEGSRFLKTKWKGEVRLREEFPDAILVRPSDIYGQEDRFLRKFGSLGRHQFKWMPLYKKGECTEKQPVYVGDVAAGIVAICKDKYSKGITYQAVGPTRYLLSELVDYFHRVMRKTGDLWGYRRYDLKYDPLFQLRVSLNPYLTFGWPIANLHWETLERESHSDEVSSSLPTLKDLGINLTRIEDQVPWELKTHRAHNYYTMGEMSMFEIPEPPKPISN